MRRRREEERQAYDINQHIDHGYDFKIESKA
jgi:hypothetical protein